MNECNTNHGTMYVLIATPILGNHPRSMLAKQPEAMGLVIMGRCLAQ